MGERSYGLAEHNSRRERVNPQYLQIICINKVSKLLLVEKLKVRPIALQLIQFSL